MIDNENERGAVLDIIEHGDLPPLLNSDGANEDEDDEASGTTAPTSPGGDGSERRRGRTSHKESLVKVVEDCEFWHSPSREAFASFPVGDHRQHAQVRSREFKNWLSGTYWRATGGTVGNNALEETLRLFEARAVNDGLCYQPYIRVGRDDERLYLDLADAQWRAVEISKQGWRVVDEPPVRFIRPATMLALPEPESGGQIEEFRRFVNVKSDDDFKLVVAWLVGALRVELGGYALLAVGGEQASGKSFFSKLVRGLIDPAIAPIRAMPRDERDLIISAARAHVLAWDNISSIPAWASDAFCRLATGGGFATRRLHSDDDEHVIEATRPQIVNGIGTLTTAADLASRALVVNLATIPESERRTEAELQAEFNEAHPRILGALLDAVSAALRNWDCVKLDKMPRLADFARFVSAAESGLGWSPGEFMAAYTASLNDVSAAAFEADPIAGAICKFVTREKYPQGWHGSATALLSELTPFVSDAVRKSRRWPVSASGMGNAVRRCAPLLRERGFEIAYRHSGSREIAVVPPPAGYAPEASTAPVPDGMDAEVPV